MIERIRRKRNAEDIGICFEPLELRLLLSGSWGAGVDNHSPDPQPNTQGDFTQETAVLFESTGTSGVDVLQQSKSQPGTGTLVDILASAPAIDEFTAFSPVREAAPSEGQAAPAPSDTHTASVDDVSSSASDPEPQRELVFVAENVGDYGQLIADLQGTNDNRTIEVVVLESDRNGIEQVSEILSDRSNLSAVHFISHGADGQINLGNTWLDSTSLQQNRDAVAGWGKALTESGDILFYGCNIAADNAGQGLLDDIAKLTNADVAASNDATGNENIGGDWQLEANKGHIETAIAPSAAFQQHWNGLLANAPVLTTTGSALAYTENAAATAVDPGLTVTDMDSTNLTGATVTISANYVNGEDVLSFTNQLGITGSWAAGTGILTLSGTTTVANYQAALRAVKYANSSENPNTSTRTVSFTTTDGALSSNTVTRDIAVNAVNDAPTYIFGDGKLTTAVGAGHDNGRSVTVQADGKILVAGQSWTGSNYDFALVRYNSDGTLDTSFSGDGKLTTAIGPSDDYGYSVTVQADGKILVAGLSFNGGNWDFALVRYNSDGTLDTSFSGDGKLTTAIGAFEDYGYSVTVQADGKILVAGQSSFDIAVARYNSDGTLDTSFSGDGKLTTAIAPGIGDDAGRSVTVQADGKILVAGYSQDASNNYEFSLVRYNSDGTLDTSFSGDGMLTTEIGVGLDHGYSVTVQADGKILLAGRSYNGANYDFALVRYNSDGTLDTSFSGDGKLTTAIGAGFDEGYSVTVQADGKILVAGYSNNGSNDDFALVRYNSDGTLDTSFSGDGKLTTAIGAGHDGGYSVTVQADGKILVAGYSHNGSNDDFALVRYNSDGTLDTSFDSTNTLGGTVAFTEGGAAVVLDADVQVLDTELSAADNFNGATLTLVRNGGADAQDVYSATGTLSSISAASGNLIVGGVTIGTYTNSGGTLVLTFNANATNARVNSANQQIAYSNSSDAPPASVQINWTFNDGNAGAQGSGGPLTATGSVTVNITPVNDASVLAAVEGTALAYTENQAATAITATVTTSDVDNTNLASATIQITTNYVNGQDVLSFTNTGSITGTWTAATGTLTLSGSDTVANYQAALRAVKYQNTSENPSGLTRTVSFTVHDGTANSNTVTRNIAVTPVNDASELAAIEGTALAYTENQAATAITATVTASDVDNTLASATIQITTNYVNGQDVLSFTNTGSITGTWTAATGTLTLSGSDTVANYQAALRAVKYANSSENPNTSTRTVSFTTTDGALSSNTVTRDIAVTAVNDAPTYIVGDGKLTTAIGANDNGRSVTVQTDGKILVAGYSANGGGSDFALVRYNSDGTLDTSFSGDGKLTTNILTSDDYGYSLTVQADGKILVAGASHNGGTWDIGLVRYNSDGTLDPSFSGDGKLTTEVLPGVNDLGYSVTVQADGKILVAGASWNASAWDFALGRYNSDGSLDTSFSGDGKLTTGFGATSDIGYSVTVQADGKILVAGNSIDSNNGNAEDFALVRYNSDGTLDTSFSGDGMLTTAIGTSIDYGRSVTVQADGKILVAGHSHNGSNYDFALVRYNSDGTLDTSFSGDGKLTTAIGASDDYGWSVTVPADGKILVAGYSVNGSNNDFALVRYNSDGTLDTSFSGDGKLTTAIGAGTDEGYSVTVQGDGKILVAGHSNNGSNDDFALARYNSDGTLDTTFDPTNTLGGTVAFTEGGAAVVLDADVQVFDTELSAADNFNGATLTLVRNGGASAQDVYSATGTLSSISAASGNLIVGGVTIGTYTNSGGTLVLTFNANATNARVNSANQQIAYSNSSDAPPASVQINWTFNDGNAGAQGSGGPLTATGSVTVNITPVNDASVLAAVEGTALAYTENQAATAITATVTTSDVDNTNLASATIQITTNYVNGQDVLSFTNTGSITGTWTAATGTLTLSGSDTVANYQAALRAVKYQNTSENPSGLTRTVSFTVHDGTANSNTVTRNIAVTPVNDASELAAIEGTALAYTENQAATAITATVTASDVDNTLASATIQITTNYVNGQDVLSFTNTGSITGTWTAATGTLTLSGSDTVANYQAALRAVKYANSSENPNTSTRTVSFTTTDGALSSNTVTRDIAVTAVNDAPTYIVGDGKLTTAIGANDNGRSVTVQTDGKILVAGYSANGGGSDFALVRYNSDGTLDTSFSGDGKLTTNILTSDDYGYSLTVQADGKILVAGTSHNGSDWDIALVRYNSDGTLDASFSGDGKLTTAIGTSHEGGYSVTVQADGKILVAGQSWNASDVDFALVRYNSDGTLDTSFSGDGKLTTAIGASDDYGYSVTVQADGKILVAGHSSNDFALVRYNSDGTLDTSFSGDGKLTTAIGAGNDFGYSVTVQADGKILVAGASHSGSNYDFALARYNSDGTLDTSFSGDGKLTTAIGASDDYGWSVTVPADGKILVAGYSANGSNNDFALVRYNSDGTLDPSFSGDGKLTTAIGAGHDEGYSVTVQADGKILVAGYSSNGSNDDFALVRYNSDGTLDTSFDSSFTNTLGGTVAFTEGGAAVVLDADVQVLDAELSAADNFNGATLSLARNGGANAQDLFSATGTLAALNQGGSLIVGGTTIGTVTTNSGGTLLLTLNSNATNTLVNSALQQIAYSNSSDAPPASVQINWTFNDGNAGAQGSGGPLTATGSVTVNITPVNDASVLAAVEGTALAYTENQAATAITATVTTSDVDNTNLASATIQITTNYVNGQDVLSFTNTGSITGTWTAATGTLTLSGSDTVANYQAALRAVKYQNTSENPSGLTRTVSFTVHDGTANSNTVTRNIAVSQQTAIIAGTVYSDEGTTPIGANKTVRIAINGTDFGTTAETDGSGAYSISGLKLAPGDVLTVYLEDEAQDAVTVTVSDGNDLAGVNLYQNRLIARHDNAGSLTNADLTTAAVASENDISNLYSTDGSHRLALGAGKELFVWAGDTFAPGANVTTSLLDIRGTYTHGAETLTVNGSYTHSQGTFSGGSGAG